MNIAVITKDPIIAEKLQSVVVSFKNVSNFKTIAASKISSNLFDDDIIYFFDTQSYPETDIAAEVFTRLGNRIIFIQNSSAISIPSDFLVIGRSLKILEICNSLAKLIEGDIASYVPFDISVLFRNEKLLCDIYLKINESKYIKIAHSGELVSVEFINKYKERNVKHIYILYSDFERFGDDLFSRELIDQKLQLSPVQRKGIENAHLHECLRNFGVSEYTVNLVEKSVEDFSNSTKNLKTKSLFKMFERSKGTFIYDHSFLTIAFSNILCKHMNWESEAIRKKISMAAMFHDLAIKDPKLAMNESLGKSELAKLDRDISSTILNHSSEIVKILEGEDSIPSEVISLCLNHHEGHGEGYPKSKSPVALTQLDGVFIISHELAIGMYRVAFNFQKFNKVIENIIEKYDSGNFKAVVNAVKIAREHEFQFE
ncbi:HD domain-containing protein [Bacteriovorax sp. Seq25_V]|uniref:HD domain-containing protein n=1 Tax=Bacteriovorax sp. Seq25_V TaxID=1201288 RepID=UPI00038A2406|nr:HD domain-containing protein [Bacteriovorax sp. Seq25_V]EQC46003.1 hypothetical protein M900_1759 [Bacteriovorax sp. Seq25_V]